MNFVGIETFTGPDRGVAGRMSLFEKTGAQFCRCRRLFDGIEHERVCGYSELLGRR